MNKKENFLFSLTKENEYYYKYISNEYNISYNWKKIGFFSKMIRFWNLLVIKIFGRNFKFFNKFACFIVYDKKLVSNILMGGRTVFLDNYLSSDFFNLIKDYNRNNTYIMIWNAIDDKTASYYLKYLKIDNIYTYSISDAHKYNFKYINDFYLTSISKHFAKSDEYDFYFLGKDKNRSSMLQSFYELVHEKYNCKIDMKSDEKDGFENGVNYFKNYISFDKYLENVAKSRCLIDLTNNTNITFRTIEALSFNIKYITNNSEIAKMDFYNDNNILIINEDMGIDKIDEFMSKPTIPVNKDIIYHYDFDYVYNYFKNIES